MSRGVLMYAHNNAEIDYFRIACANALMVQKNLNVGVSIVTDTGTLEYSKSALGQAFIDKCFEHVIIVDKDNRFKNNRIYSDSSASKTLQFYNCNHWEAYELTPYEETLFIDSDYLIMSDALNKCWGSDNSVMINYKILDPGSTKDPYSKFIDDFSIRLYWATVIYFKKDEFASYLFELIKYIQENYLYFSDLYYFTNKMYRNDHAFSIAVHMLNGFVDSSDIIADLPIPGLIMSWDTDDICTVNGLNDITVFTGKSQNGGYLLSRIKDQDIHIMNKWAINRHAAALIKLYE